MNYTELVLKLVVGYIALMVTTKVLGKTQINQLTPFDFISALVLGELVGGAIHDKDINVFQIIFVVLVWGLLIYITEFITQKYAKTRTLLEGRPAIVINKGKISFEALKSNKLDLNQLLNLLRKKDVFSIKEVEYAILESDGTASVLKKSFFDTPKRNDLNLKEKAVYIPLALVSDGEIVVENLKEANLDEEWLKSKLQAHGCNKVSECLYAEWEEGEDLHVIKY